MPETDDANAIKRTKTADNEGNFLAYCLHRIALSLQQGHLLSCFSSVLKSWILGDLALPAIASEKFPFFTKFGKYLYRVTACREMWKCL